MISGGVKFFDKAKNLYKDGTSIQATSGQTSAKYMLDNNIYTQWESMGSNDATNEEIVITLRSSMEINRIFLSDFNLKSFEVLYWNGSTYIAFTNVVGVNGVTYTGIDVSGYALDSAYFEFDNVTTDRIQIIAKTTQVVDAQKYITKCLVTKEIGTFLGFPRVDNVSDRNEEKVKTIGGKWIVQKSFETVQIKINLKSHPYQADNDIVESLFDSEDTFLVYPCGGRTGTTYFKIAQKTWGLKDVFNMQLTGNIDNKFEKGVYILGVTKDITLVEAI